MEERDKDADVQHVCELVAHRLLNSILQGLGLVYYLLLMLDNQMADS